jgi:hypothetical protein
LADSQQVFCGIVIQLTAFLTVYDVIHFCSPLLTPFNDLNDDEFPVTLCSYKRWPHAALITATPAILNTINTDLFDESILNFDFQFDTLTDKNMSYVVTKSSDPVCEELARSPTIQMIKRQCPPTAHDALATLISNAHSAEAVFNGFMSLTREHATQTNTTTTNPLPERP